MCKKNIYNALKLTKQCHNLITKPRSCMPGDKVLSNNQYIETKLNCN